MRADICVASDEKAVQRFRQVLERLGAQLVSRHDSSLGVDIYQFLIGNQKLIVYSDIWLSIDIEGSANLVRRVLNEFAKEEIL
jgi:hypothetical protein